MDSGIQHSCLWLFGDVSIDPSGNGYKNEDFRKKYASFVARMFILIVLNFTIACGFCWVCGEC